MRKIIVSTFVSLDGIMQSPGGPAEDPTGGFALGGWVPPFADAATHAAILDIFSRPFELLLGRKTYEIFAAHWPYITDPDHPIAVPFNRVTKYVASRAEPKLSWMNSTWLGTDVVASLKALKGGDGPDLIVQGSSDFLQTLWKHGLVDELTTLTFPIVLGKGKRLFADDAPPFALKLTRSKSGSTGVIVAHYEHAGAVQTGNFQLPEPTEAERERRRNLTD